MGWMSIEQLLDLKAGKTIPATTDTGVIIVTKDNVDTYMAEVKAEVQ